MYIAPYRGMNNEQCAAEQVVASVHFKVTLSYLSLFEFNINPLLAKLNAFVPQ